MNDDQRQERNERSAKTVLKLFNERLMITSHKATLGDKNASLDVLKLLADRDWTLKQLGYETGETGRLRKYRKPTKAQQMMTNLLSKAVNGDTDAATKMLEIMSARIPQ